MTKSITHKLSLFILSFFIVLSAFAQEPQTKDEKKFLKKARKYLTEADYEKAQANYSKLLKIDPNNGHYNYEMGLAYYNEERFKEKALPYFLKAIEVAKPDTSLEIISNSLGEVYYYLGRTYQYMSEYDKAIEAYKKFKVYIADNSTGEALSKSVDRYLEMCRLGKQYEAELNKDVQVENLGGNVNSVYPEYVPVVKDDNTLLIFAARKKGSTGGKFYNDDEYYEDIYVSKYDGKEWRPANKIDSVSDFIEGKVNSKKHDAPIGFSADEKKLFIYKQNHVWMSEYKDQRWTEPKKMEGDINSKGFGNQEPHVYLTPDEKTLYVVSNRKGGFGGLDLYKATLNPDSSWSDLVNLGPNINTPYDEDAPFVTADGKTLYYSSKGLETMGGFDIFSTTMDSSGNFTTPKNIGAPVNGPGDDIFYVVDKKDEVAFYSSSRPGGYGNMDIYKVLLICPNIPKTEIRGILLAGTSRTPKGGQILVTDNTTGKKVGTFPIDPETGKYLMVLKPENSYTMELIPNDYKYQHKQTFTLPRQCEFYQNYQEVHIEYLDSLGDIYAQKAKFHNALFDIEQEIERREGLSELAEAPATDIKDSIAPVSIISILKYNTKTPAEEIYVALANEEGEIIDYTTTNESGMYRFDNITPNKSYKVLISDTDLKNKYYGENSEEVNTIVMGDIYYHNLPNDDFDMKSEPADDLSIYLTDDNHKVINSTTSDKNGYYIIDNVTIDEEAVAELNKTPLKDNFNNNKDRAYSNFISTISTGDSLNYNEYVDIVPFETSPEKPSDMIVFKNILFDFDKADLRNMSTDELNKIYNYLNKNEDLTVQLDGYTDWIGTDAYNKVLSKKRAIAAYKYLKEKGLDEKRLSYKYFGESKPVAPNENTDGSDNPMGRQLNRRVEFKINSKEMVENIIMKY